MKKPFSSSRFENKRGIACFVVALLCLVNTGEAQFVSARKQTENKKEVPKQEASPQVSTADTTEEVSADSTPKSEPAIELEAPNDGIPKAKRRATMGVTVKTDSKSFFKQRNISSKLYFPIRSPYIPRVGGTDIRQEPVRVDLDRNGLIRETSASEALEAPTVVSQSPQDIISASPKDAADAGNATLPANDNVTTYQFQDRELVIDERHLQAIDPSKVPQNKFIIKHLRNTNEPDVKEPQKPQKTVLSSEYKGNMELVDPNEVLMFFEKEQDDGDKITVGTPFVVPYENGPTPVESKGSSANYEVTK